MMNSSLLTEVEKALEQAVSRVENNSEESFRIFHGRGHCYEGLSFLNIDLHPPVLLVTCYDEQSEAFFESLQQLLERFAKALMVEAVLLQKRFIRGAPFTVLSGELPEKVYANSDGLKFSLNLDSNQNIGFFLDMKPGHFWLRERSENKRVLNLFAYTCAFSVFAMAGKADSVVNIDMSGAAINKGVLNHMLNSLSTDRVGFLPHNIFKSIKKLKQKGPYDLIVIDPPANQKGSFVTRKDYARLLRYLPDMMADGCEILACLNTPALGEEFLLELFQENLPQCEFVERLAANPDFPESDPQRNLKLMVFRLA